MNPPFELTYNRSTAAVLAEIAGARAVLLLPDENLPDGTRGPGTRPAREHSRRYREQLESIDALTWETLLTEAYSWAMAEDDPAALRGGLIRLAARATAWVEAIDRRMAGEGSDGNHPTDGPAQPLAGEQAEPVRQDARNALRASEAVPDEVFKAGRAAADSTARSADGYVTLIEMVNAAIDATWRFARRDASQAQRTLDAALHKIHLTGVPWKTVPYLTVEEVDAVTDAIQRHQRLVDAAEDLGTTPEHLEEHDSGEPMHIAGYDPGPPIVDETHVFNRAWFNNTIAGQRDDPPLSDAGHREAEQEAQKAVREGLAAALANTDTPPGLMPPAEATSAAEFARVRDADPTLAIARRRAEQIRPGIEHVFTTSHLVATLDRALGLLHDLLDEHWLDVPGSPVGNVMSIVDAARLAEWRQRLTAIEETPEADPNDEGPHRSRNFPVEYDDEEADRG